MPEDEDVARRAKAARVNTTLPNAARIGDYVYGGHDNFTADRRAAQVLAAVAPMLDAVAFAVRAFQQRVLRFLATEAGIGQFLDVGTGLPAAGGTHEVTQSLAPGCRIVYVDNDPMVLSHARARLRPAPGGAVGYVDADVRDTGAIVAGARATLDFGQPTAVLLPWTLAHVQDTAKAAAVVSALMAAVPSGSYVGIYHVASDLAPSLDESARQWNGLMPAQQITLRSQAEVASLTAELEPVAPGLVPVNQWRPETPDPDHKGTIPVWGTVARKP